MKIQESDNLVNYICYTCISSFFRTQDRIVEKIAILFANPKGETTLIFIFCIRVATGYSPRHVLPAIFRARVADPLHTAN